jgi:hypothetical protein
MNTGSPLTEDHTLRAALRTHFSFSWRDRFFYVLALDRPYVVRSIEA